MRLENARDDFEDGWAEQHDADHNCTPADQRAIHVLSNNN
jgi:hypothetical protein